MPHTPAPHILYGMAGSLYTAKVRSYLRKQRIAFEERVAGDPAFGQEMVPVVGRWIIPVVQTPDGRVLQDGAAIIDALEQEPQAGPRAAPPHPVLGVIAHILEMFGGEGMLRPAMHYRWNFDEANLAFLQQDFVSSLAPGKVGDEAAMVFAFASSRMRKATLSFGVTADTAALVEHSYTEFLALLEAHLAHMPYLLGDSPTYADYGLIGPMFGHLARDPHPAMLMKRLAPRVWRWVERMNSPDSDAGEYRGRSAGWIDPGQPNPTLDALLSYVAQDYLAEIGAHVTFANEWLAQRPDLPAGSNGMPRPSDRHIGTTRVAWRSATLQISVMPYRIFMLQRVQDAAAALGQADSDTLQALLQRTGLAPLLDMRCQRRVLRQNHLEVWGPTGQNIDMLSP